MRIGTGGEANWQQHIGGAKHKDAVLEAKTAGKQKTLNGFFTTAPAPRPVPATSRDDQSHICPPVHPSSLSSDPADPLSTFTTLSRFSMPPSIARLQSAVESLPATVPEAIATDVLARFAGSLASELGPDEDAWEHVDKKLNNVVGYGNSRDQILGILRRGPLGLDGLCTWLASSILDFGVDEMLLEPKIERILDAVTEMYVTS